MAVNDTRVLMPFIVVIPHMVWRFISPGVMAFTDNTEYHDSNSDRASFSSQTFKIRCITF